ncbi:MAG: FixH family protein [Gemmobacter sp.]
MLRSRTRCAALALALSATTALGGAEDFRFELVSTDHRVGSGAIVEVSLTDLRTGTPVEDAVVFATRMDMAPDGMEMMTSPVTAMPAETPGTYRFATDITMAGGWRFSIAAKVQGEAETVEARIALKATP